VAWACSRGGDCRQWRTVARHGRPPGPRRHR
jgi:hypothetical protein